jgi:hypothetical protein
MDNSKRQEVERSDHEGFGQMLLRQVSVNLETMKREIKKAFSDKLSGRIILR